jgi:uncharacterized repeat protein (TIGR03803 family)
MTKLTSGMRACGVLVLWAGAAIALPAQTFTELHSFNLSNGNGAYPFAGLVQAADGNFYGTTYLGGGNDGGTVFKITAGGTLRKLHSFDGTDGEYPQAALVQGTNGDLYGTTISGGANGSACTNDPSGCGMVFKITTGGTLRKLHSFDGTDGEYPQAALVQATNGVFYGTTLYGGNANAACENGCGTVFQITPGGMLTTLYSFCASGYPCTDGILPESALVQGTDGNFYGTTLGGGANNTCSSATGCGTVFKIAPSGALTTLYSFCSQSNCTDGADPVAGLVQAADGNFYGTTVLGGANGGGTVFQITPSGTLTTIYNFCAETNCTDGTAPEAGLVQATDGNFYGTTAGGGALHRHGHTCSNPFGGCGTVFKITSGGTLTTLHGFKGTDGAIPSAGLI